MDVAAAEIRQCSYDPFVDDPAVIDGKLQVINELLPQKQKELEQFYKHVDTKNQQMQSLGVDLAALRQQVVEAEKVKLRLMSEIKQLQKCDEIHIQIDVLQSSADGVRQLKMRYNRLLR